MAEVSTSPAVVPIIRSLFFAAPEFWKTRRQLAIEILALRFDGCARLAVGAAERFSGTCYAKMEGCSSGGIGNLTGEQEQAGAVTDEEEEGATTSGTGVGGAL